MRQINHLILGAATATMMLTACGAGGENRLTVSGLNPAAFDSTIDGKKTELVTLHNNNGMEVCLTNYGGRVVSITVPDKDGKPTDVVLGYDNIAQYAD
ncbi:aldose epimerase family protein, partial [Segatella buccae]|uniref:aldose epimerase family protein n=1 Tax=Segatella buccae TaxID=28126 RepID=UPI003FD6C54D